MTTEKTPDHVVTTTIEEQKARANESPFGGAVAGIMRAATRSIMSFGKTGISGTLAGLSEEFAGYPLDIVKTRMQVHSHAAQRGTFGVIKDIVAHEGVGGLFKGLGPPLLASAVINSAMFSAYERALAVFQAQYIKQTTGETNMHSDRAQTVILPIPYYFLAGNAGGFASAIITCPVDVVKNKMQVMGLGHGAPTEAGVKVPSSMDVFKKVVRDGGIRGAYLGMVPTLATQVPGYGIYFFVYESMKRQLSKLGGAQEESHGGGHDVGFASVVVAGGTAGTVSHFFTHPLDVVKSVIQTQPTEKGKPLTYTGMADCIKQIHKAEGWKGFTKGIFPTCIRAFPASAIGFAVYELTLKLIPG